MDLLLLPPPQPVTSHPVQHHLTRRIFLLRPTPLTRGDMGHLASIEHAATKGLRA